MSYKARPVLIKQWSYDGKEYRLLKEETGYYRADVFTVELDEKDTLGAPRWTPLYAWKVGMQSGSQSDTVNRVLNALVTLVRMQETAGR